MCQPKPGLRCSNHAKQALDSARAKLEKVQASPHQVTLPEAEQEFARAQYEYNLTPAGMSDLESRIKTVQENGDEEGLQQAQNELSEAKRSAEERKEAAKSYQECIEAFESSSYSVEATDDLIASDIEQALAGAETDKEKVSRLQERIDLRDSEWRRANKTSRDQLSMIERRIREGRDVDSSEIILAAKNHMQAQRQLFMMNALQREKSIASVRRM